MGRDGNVSARTGAPSGTRTAAQTKRRIANLKQVIHVLLNRKRVCSAERQASKPYTVAPLGRTLARAISSASLGGVIGICAMRTPNGDSASSIADMIAAAAGMTPTSPTPFTPNGLCGDGDSL